MKGILAQTTTEVIRTGGYRFPSTISYQDVIWGSIIEMYNCRYMDKEAEREPLKTLEMIAPNGEGGNMRVEGTEETVHYETYIFPIDFDKVASFVAIDEGVKYEYCPKSFKWVKAEI